jgi:hypothetical protein
MKRLLARIQSLMRRSVMSVASVAITQADLVAIADSCGAPRDWLVLRGQEVVLRASPDEDETMLACVLTKMSALLSAHNADADRDAQGSEDK